MLNKLTEEVIKRFYEWVDRTADLESDAFDAFKEILEEELPRDRITLMGLASKHMFLAILEPEPASVLNGKFTPINLVYGNLYEFLEGILWKKLDSLGTTCSSCYGEGVLHADGYSSIGCPKCNGEGEVFDG